MKFCPDANFSENKSVHQLLDCAHFAHFDIYPGMLIFILSVVLCQMRLQMSPVKNVGSIFELSGVAFREPRLRVGFLFKFCNRYIFTFGGWLYFS